MYHLLMQRDRPVGEARSTIGVISPKSSLLNSDGSREKRVCLFELTLWGKYRHDGKQRG